MAIDTRNSTILPRRGALLRINQVSPSSFYLPLNMCFNYGWKTQILSVQCCHVYLKLGGLHCESTTVELGLCPVLGTGWLHRRGCQLPKGGHWAAAEQTLPLWISECICSEACCHCTHKFSLWWDFLPTSRGTDPAVSAVWLRAALSAASVLLFSFLLLLSLCWRFAFSSQYSVLA